MMIDRRKFSYHIAATAVASLSATAIALGGGDGVPDYDFDWAVIGDPGNTGWSGEIPRFGTGRGAVEYTFRMSKMEVSSAQWLEFITTIRPVLGDSTFAEPTSWGYFDIFPGEYKGNTPDPDNTPVFGISWRQSAMYVNWLHNNKEASLAAISNGAYDISTFGYGMYGVFTDQLTRNPDAKFWIPSLDEWLKAAHYDPNNNGEGQGDYWLYSNTSDTAPTPGPPGEGETSAGYFDWEVEGFNYLTSRDVPLGAYPDVTSPWGLLDVSGGALEWTQADLGNINRVTMGAYASFQTDEELFSLDRIDMFGGLNPSSSFVTTIRVASAILNTGTGFLMVMWTTPFFATRRKRWASSAACSQPDARYPSPRGAQTRRPWSLGFGARVS